MKLKKRYYVIDGEKLNIKSGSGSAYISTIVDLCTGVCYTVPHKICDGIGGMNPLYNKDGSLMVVSDAELEKYRKEAESNSDPF